MNWPGAQPAMPPMMQQYGPNQLNIPPEQPGMMPMGRPSMMSNMMSHMPSMPSMPQWMQRPQFPMKPPSKNMLMIVMIVLLLAAVAGLTTYIILHKQSDDKAATAASAFTNRKLGSSLKNAFSKIGSVFKKK